VGGGRAFRVVLELAALQAYSQTPLYRASARLLIELEDERSLAMEGWGTLEADGIHLRPRAVLPDAVPHPHRRELAERVVQSLDLRTMPDLNGSAPPRRGVARAIAAGASHGGAGCGASRARRNPPRRARRHARPPSPSSRRAVGGAGARQPLVDVTFVSSDPDTAARAINALVDEYVKQNLAVRQQDMSKSLMWLSEELAAPGEPRRGQRTRDGRIPRRAQRRLAARPREHRHLAPQSAQRVGHARPHRRAQKESLYKQIEALGPRAAAETVPAIASNPVGAVDQGHAWLNCSGRRRCSRSATATSTRRWSRCWRRSRMPRGS
jgi:hypothetical protein